MKKNKNKTIVLLDAHAIIHRAYHALPAFSSSKGEPTGALYGLVTMILRIVQEFKPDYIVAAYDLPKPTFRHVAYEAYKGKRIKADDDLKTQLNLSRKVFDAFGIPHIDAEGFEADDVLGTLVEQLSKEKDLSIIIASGDMDTMQLVDKKKVQVYTLKKGITDTVLYDEAAVEERFGFAPELLPDYKGLRGDNSDNIIGIPGIGEKTATTLIAAFGTIEKIYKQLKKDESVFKEKGISARNVQLLKDHEEEAFFSKTLATIRRDAPISFSIPKKTFRESFDVKKATDLCALYEFRSLVPRMKALSLEEGETSPKEVLIERTTENTKLLKETSVALWVLNSDYTNPSFEDILLYTKKETLEDAHTWVMAELQKQGVEKIYTEIEAPIIPIIEAMEQYGVLIDRDCFSKLVTQYQTQLKKLEEEIISLAGMSFNVNSPKQLSEVLFDKLGLKAKGKRKESGAFTTNAEVLDELREAHPIISKILEYREGSKLLSTYLLTIPEKAGIDDRLHAKFIQHGTTTGRFSSNEPNMQNLPARGEGGKQIRQGFIAPSGSQLLSLDYSQIELRILAILSGDQKLIETFQKGEDVHTSVASYMFKVEPKDVTSDMRRKAKVINFGIIYGMGVSALQKNLKTNRAEAQAFYDNYFVTFPKIAAYLEGSKESARETGYSTTLFGRRRYFPQIKSKLPFLKAFAERTAANAPIQGTAADVIKLAIGFADTDIKAAGLENEVHLTMQIHDELVYEVREGSEEKALTVIKKAMEEVFERSYLKQNVSVPLLVSSSFGRTLGDVK